jgi:hypothetical protein
VSQSNQLFALEYEPEGSWAENVAMTPTHRIPVLGPITPDFTQDMVEPERAVQQLQGGTAPILGPKSGSFRFSIWATGHGSPTSGAITLDAMETLVGYGFGNPSLGEPLSAPTRSAASGTTAAGGSTTTNVVTAASGTFARGSLCRLGAAGDARGGGKFYAINNHTGTSLLLRHATQGALNAADVVHAAVNFYFPETIAGTAVKGLRFRFLSGDKKYIARGCWIQSVALTSTNVSERPRWEFEVGVSEWDTTDTGSFPSAVASNQHNPAPVCGGAIQVQDAGVTTRNERNARDFTLTIETGIQPLRGHGGVWPYQTFVGAVRTPSKIRASWIETAGDGHDTWEAKYLAGTAQSLTASLSINAGSALGVHIQQLRLDKRPIQIVNDNVNSVQLEGYACAGDDLATELSQAAAVIAYA